MYVSVSMCVYVLRVQVCHSKPCKAGNEQAEDCSNDVTQMSRVQAENESVDQGLVPPFTPTLLHPPSIRLGGTIAGYLTAGNMHACKCMRCQASVFGVCAHPIHVNPGDQILECVPLVLGAPD